MVAAVAPPQIASERCTFRLSSAEFRQLKAYSAAEGVTHSEAIREALYSTGVLELTEAGRTRPGPSTVPLWRSPDEIARSWARRYLRRRGYRVLGVLRSLPGLHFLALDPSQVRAIVVADAASEAPAWPDVDLPPTVSMERWTINGDDEPNVELLREP
jgi:hypothetical protein